MTLRKVIHEGDLLPAWYGFAWYDYPACQVVCYPVPLNVVCVLCRAVWVWLRHGGRAIPANLRDAYALGYRDGWWKARGREDRP